MHGPTTEESGEAGAAAGAPDRIAGSPAALATSPAPFLWLGYAGLLPPLALLAMLASHRGTLAAPMLVATAIGYAALIFSFLGGVWWGLLLGSGRRVGFGSVALSVMPSLIALMLVFAAARVPVAAPLALSAMIALSPVVDWELARHRLVPPWWLPLRIALSLGLAALTTAVVLLAAR